MKKTMKAFLVSLGIMLLISGCAATQKEEAAAQTDTDSFYITEITDDIFSRIEGKSFKEECTLPREDLRYLHVLHKDLVGNTLEGEIPG